MTAATAWVVGGIVVTLIALAFGFWAELRKEAAAQARVDRHAARLAFAARLDRDETRRRFDALTADVVINPMENTE